MNRGEEADIDAGDVQTVSMDDEEDEAHGVRTRLPDIGGKIEVKISSFLKQLKQAIGKDLASIRLPIELNEPLSFLQRLAEDVEYSELFDKASECSDQHERMMWVACAVISHYNSTEGRMSKPFNPLLCETYELYTNSEDNPGKKGFRFVAEQVSHHPPISACYCEASDGSWKYYNTIQVKSKFHTNSISVNPIGLNTVEIPEHDDVYTFNQVTSCVHNLFTGVTAGRWLENYGTMTITNRATGDMCEIRFRKYSNYPRKRPFAVVKATVRDSEGHPVLYLGGKWNRQIHREDKHGHTHKQHPDALWENEERPSREVTNGYHWTRWTIRLNQPLHMDTNVACPTDSRLRPDQRALENGEIARAKVLKHSLEERQRARQRARNADETYEPLWFDKAIDEVTGMEHYKFNGEYFKARDTNDWKKYTERGMDIFACDGVEEK